jgi:hypothetical protein
MTESKWSRDLQEIFGDSSSDESVEDAVDVGAQSRFAVETAAREPGRGFGAPNRTPLEPKAHLIKDADYEAAESRAEHCVAGSPGGAAPVQGGAGAGGLRRHTPDYYLLRLPFKFIGIEALENRESQSHARTDSRTDAPAGPWRNRSKKPALIRWRRNPTTGEWESNARIIEWSDGSRTLHIGDRVALELIVEQGIPGREHVICGDPQRMVNYNGEIKGHFKTNVDPAVVQQLLAGARVPSTAKLGAGLEKELRAGDLASRSFAETGRSRRVQVAALDRAPESEEKTLLDFENQRRKAEQRIEARRRRRGQRLSHNELLAPQQLGVDPLAGEQRRDAGHTGSTGTLARDDDSGEEASDADSAMELLDDRRFGVRQRTNRDEDAELERLEAMLDDDHEDDHSMNSAESASDEALVEHETPESTSEHPGTSPLDAAAPGAAVHLQQRSRAGAGDNVAASPSSETAVSAEPQAPAASGVSATASSSRRRMLVTSDEEDA